jgi:hypothetical protein
VNRGKTIVKEKECLSILSFHAPLTMGDSQFSESPDPRDNPERNTPRIEFAKGVNGYTQQGGEIIANGGDWYPNGVPYQPAPAGPSTQTHIAAFEGANNLSMIGTRVMTVGGDIYGTPQRPPIRMFHVLYSMLLSTPI